jgi:hypothetical protein
MKVEKFCRWKTALSAASRSTFLLICMFLSNYWIDKWYHTPKGRMAGRFVTEWSERFTQEPFLGDRGGSGL